MNVRALHVALILISVIPPITMALSGAACATVAGVDNVTPPDPNADNDNTVRDNNDAAALVDGAASSSSSSSGSSGTTPTSSEGIACGCDAGQACCVSTTGASSGSGCVAPEATCNGMRLVCRRGSDDGRECCWNSPDSGTSAFVSTSYALKCATGRVACLEQKDCVAYGGGACMTAVCSGAAVVGVCAQPSSNGSPTTNAPACL